MKRRHSQLIVLNGLKLEHSAMEAVPNKPVSQSQPKIVLEKLTQLCIEVPLRPSHSQDLPPTEHRFFQTPVANFQQQQSTNVENVAIAFKFVNLCDPYFYGRGIEFAKNSVLDNGLDE